MLNSVLEQKYSSKIIKAESMRSKTKCKPLASNREKFDLSITNVENAKIGLLGNWDQFSNQQRKRYTLAIAGDIDRMIDLVTNMLDLSKLQKPNSHLEMSRVDFSELLTTEIKESSILNNENIEFAFDIDPELVIYCNRHYITKALNNLFLYIINSKWEKIETKVTCFIALKQKFDFPKQQRNSVKSVELLIQFTNAPNLAILNQISGLQIGSIDDIDLRLELFQKIIALHEGKIIFEPADGLNNAWLTLSFPSTCLLNDNHQMKTKKLS